MQLIKKDGARLTAAPQRKIPPRLQPKPHGLKPFHSVSAAEPNSSGSLLKARQKSFRREESIFPISPALTDNSPHDSARCRRKAEHEKQSRRQQRKNRSRQQRRGYFGIKPCFTRNIISRLCTAQAISPPIINGIKVFQQKPAHNKYDCPYRYNVCRSN